MFDNLQDLEEQDFEQLVGGKCPLSMLHLLFFLTLLYAYMHAVLKHDTYLYCLPSVSTFLPLDDG
jgi:hypothetical protein